MVSPVASDEEVERDNIRSAFLFLDDARLDRPARFNLIPLIRLVFRGFPSNVVSLR